MLLFLWRLFVIGFPDKCKHDFDKWEITKVMNGSCGERMIYQERKCKKCGWTDSKRKYHY